MFRLPLRGRPAEAPGAKRRERSRADESASSARRGGTKGETARERYIRSFTSQLREERTGGSRDGRRRGLGWRRRRRVSAHDRSEAAREGGQRGGVREARRAWRQPGAHGTARAERGAM